MEKKYWFAIGGGLCILNFIYAIQNYVVMAFFFSIVIMVCTSLFVSTCAWFQYRHMTISLACLIGSVLAMVQIPNGLIFFVCGFTMCVYLLSWLNEEEQVYGFFGKHMMVGYAVLMVGGWLFPMHLYTSNQLFALIQLICLPTILIYAFVIDFHFIENMLNVGIK